MSESTQLSSLTSVYLSKAQIVKQFGLTIPTCQNLLDKYNSQIRQIEVGESKRVKYHSGDLATLIK